MEALTIGQLGRISQVSVDTIRFYERQGLIRPSKRSRSGYRLYGDDAPLRLSFIRKAQSLGFTLGEIKTLLSLNASRTAQCEQMLTITTAKIREVREQLSDLLRMRRTLSRLAKECPGDRTPTADCPILAFLRSPKQRKRVPRQPARY